jgi:uncharacterized membrane protein
VFVDRLPKGKLARIEWAAALAVSAVLLMLPWLVKLDGRPHADWQQFLGRFHPLAVHLPIGLIVLVPLLEIVGAFKPALREAAGFVLGLGFVSCLGSLALGFLLAYGSGDAGAGVTRHMWGGISLTISVLWCSLARADWETGSVQRVYPAMLIGVLLVMTWAAHQGGSLTHGSNYLTAYMPASLKRWSMLGGTPANEPPSNSFYSMHIHPILDAKCVACHGDGKIEGGLRMDSYERLMKGGKDGPVIVAGAPAKSLLLERVTLPADHKKFMPAEGKPPLKPDEIAWIRTWIEQGASPTATTLKGIAIREQRKELPLEPVGDYSGMMAGIRQLDQGQGAKLMQVSVKASDGLILNTIDVAGSFDDAQLLKFEKFAPYIVEAELGHTAVTDASFDTLAKFTHLRALHMEETRVNGDGLRKLAPLSELTYLNLSGTQVTKASIAALAPMKNLRNVYLYNTPAGRAGSAESTQPIARNVQ